MKNKFCYYCGKNLVWFEVIEGRRYDRKTGELSEKYFKAYCCNYLNSHFEYIKPSAPWWKIWSNA